MDGTRMHGRAAQGADPAVAEAKTWRSCRLTIGGRQVAARYSEQAIDALMRPLLRRMAHLAHQRGRRAVLFLAAPPGAGKTTLASFFEKLAQATEGALAVQALALDGFHYHADYIATHSVLREGLKIPMRQIKGAPETYDVEHFLAKLSTIREAGVRWPFYDRVLHDVVEDVAPVRAPVVVLEGNWLLLGEEKWRKARDFADYTVMIRARAQDLRERLIARKAASMTRAAAEAFYEQSDRANIGRVLQGSWPADETWRLLADGDYARCAAPKPLSGAARAAFWKQPNVEIDDPYFLRVMNERLAAIGRDATREGAYAKGFAEGLQKARADIIRKLCASGMAKAEVMKTFRIGAQELGALLRGEG